MDLRIEAVAGVAETEAKAQAIEVLEVKVVIPILNLL